MGAAQTQLQSLSSSIETLNYIQEVDIMNSHLFEIITSEKSMDYMHSAELFTGIVAVICVVGLLFIAVA